MRQAQLSSGAGTCFQERPPQEIIEKMPITRAMVRKKTRISPEVRLVSMKDMITPLYEQHEEIIERMGIDGDRKPSCKV